MTDQTPQTEARWQPGEALAYAVSQYHDNGYWSDRNRTHTDPEHHDDCTDEVCVAIRRDVAQARTEALDGITGPVLAEAWARSGRHDPLSEPDAWAGFALVVRAILAGETE